MDMLKQHKDKFYVELTFHEIFMHDDILYAPTAIGAVNKVISNLNERLIEDDCNPVTIGDATKIVVIKLLK